MSEVNAEAFNAGSDARLAGRPLAANPYLPRTALAEQWRHGWDHVSRYWGCDCRRRWIVKPLPQVREGVTA